MSSGFDAGLINADFFTRINLPHILRIGTNTLKIEPLGGKPMSFTDNTIPAKYLGFINKVKKCVRNSFAFHANKDYLVRLSPLDCTYIRANENRVGVYDDVCEIDINGAYWCAAKELGYISHELYSEGIARGKDGKLIIPKQIRLIALGALAASYSVRHFLPEQGYIYKGVERDAQLAGVFFDVARHVGNTMSECVDEIGLYGFMLFWVDAFVCERANKDLVISFFRKKGYDTKVVDYSHFEIAETSQGKIALCIEKSKVASSVKWWAGAPRFSVDNSNPDMARFCKAQRSRKKYFTLSSANNKFVEISEFISQINAAKRTKTQ